MNEKARQLVLGIVALMIVGVAIGLFFMRSEGDVTPDEFRVNGVCLACQEEVGVEVSLSNPPPCKCPECGEVAVYRQYYCNDCQKVFVMPLTRRDRHGRPKPPRIPTCSDCGSGDVVVYPPLDPNAPEPEIKERLPLPPWPPDLPE